MRTTRDAGSVVTTKPKASLTTRALVVVSVCSVIVVGAVACSADPTGEMSAAPGITSQQPNDGTPVDVELVSPDGCPALSDGSEWATLVAEGSLPERVSGCEEHNGRGVYRYTVRMHGAGELLLSSRQTSTVVDVAEAVASGQVSLDYQPVAAGRYDTQVEYSLFTDS